MSYNFAQIYTLLIIISFVLSFISLSLLTFLFIRMRQVLKQQEEIILLDKKINRRVTKKLESLATEKIDEVIKATGTRLEENLKKHFADLSKFAAEESNEMGQFIIKQQETITRETQYHVANMLMKSDKQVEEYRRRKMNEVDQQVRDVVFRAAREVIGRAISFTEHEDLVNKALERAKKEKLFP